MLDNAYIHTYILNQRRWPWHCDNPLALLLRIYFSASLLHLCEHFLHLLKCQHLIKGDICDDVVQEGLIE